MRLFLQLALIIVLSIRSTLADPTALAWEEIELRYRDALSNSYKKPEQNLEDFHKEIDSSWKKFDQRIKQFLPVIEGVRTKEKQAEIALDWAFYLTLAPTSSRRSTLWRFFIITHKEANFISGIPFGSFLKDMKSIWLDFINAPYLLYREHQLTAYEPESFISFAYQIKKRDPSIPYDWIRAPFKDDFGFGTSAMLQQKIMRLNERELKATLSTMHDKWQLLRGLKTRAAFVTAIISKRQKRHSALKVLGAFSLKGHSKTFASYLPCDLPFPDLIDPEDLSRRLAVFYAFFNSHITLNEDGDYNLSDDDFALFWSLLNKSWHPVRFIQKFFHVIDHKINKSHNIFSFISEKLKSYTPNASFTLCDLFDYSLEHSKKLCLIEPDQVIRSFIKASKKNRDPLTANNKHLRKIEIVKDALKRLKSRKRGSRSLSNLKNDRVKRVDSTKKDFQ